MFGSAYFLAGDSFLTKTAIEDAVRQRLAPLFSNWIGREEIKVRSEESHSRLGRAPSGGVAAGSKAASERARKGAL